MFQEFRDLLARSEATLLQDAAGAVSLMVILVVGLHLPGVF
ncbi:hypothetical protein [Tropicimonas sp.]